MESQFGLAEINFHLCKQKNLVFCVEIPEVLIPM